MRRLLIAQRGRASDKSTTLTLAAVARVMDAQRQLAGLGKKVVSSRGLVGRDDQNDHTCFFLNTDYDRPKQFMLGERCLLDQ